MLPLAELHKVVPREGTVIEIGCGHGLITNYLSLTSEDRSVIGIDIDEKRIHLARQAVGERKNIQFLHGEFSDFAFAGVDMVILFGVLLLIPFSEWRTLFEAIYRALRPGGQVLLHDVKKADTAVYHLHRFKEKVLHLTGVTKGAGFFVMDSKELDCVLKSGGFSICSLGRELDVPFHSCFTYLLTKEASPR